METCKIKISIISRKRLQKICLKEPFIRGSASEDQRFYQKLGATLSEEEYENAGKTSGSQNPQA